jgi:hypothetical protein
MILAMCKRPEDKGSFLEAAKLGPPLPKLVEARDLRYLLCTVIRSVLFERLSLKAENKLADISLRIGQFPLTRDTHQTSKTALLRFADTAVSTDSQLTTATFGFGSTIACLALKHLTIMAKQLKYSMGLRSSLGKSERDASSAFTREPSTSRFSLLRA